MKKITNVPHAKGLWLHTNGIWYAEFQYNGKVYKKSTGCTEKEVREAEKFLENYKKEVMQRLDNPKLFNDSRMKLSQAIDRMYQDKWITNNSGEQIKDRAMQFIDWLGEDPYLSKIDQQTVTKIRNAMLEREFKPATMTKYMSYLRQIMAEAVQTWNACKSMPKIVGFGDSPKVTEFLQLDELAKLVYYFRTTEGPGYPEVADILQVLANTGLRAGELEGMRYEQYVNGRLSRTWVDLTTKRVISYDNKESAKSKSQKIKVIPMNDEVYGVLKRRQMNAEGRPDPLNPFTLTGRQVYFRLQTAFAHLKDELKVSRLKVHLFRHTFATHAYRMSKDLRAVADLLGHESIEMTTRYAHGDNSVLQGIVGSLGVEARKAQMKMTLTVAETQSESSSVASMQ